MKKLDTQKNGKPCIYSIRNNINGKLYIGSAIGHYRRKAQHFYLLRRGLHWNKHLQSSYNKYGESIFEFIVIEFIENIEDLQKKEELKSGRKCGSYIKKSYYSSSLSERI